MDDLRFMAFNRHRLVKVDRDEMLLLGELSVRDRRLSRLGFLALQRLRCLHGLTNDWPRRLIAWEVTDSLSELRIVVHDTACGMFHSNL